MNAVDTNILIYVRDPRDPVKQTISASLTQSLADGVLLWQVACEYLAASRKLEPFGYDRAQAWRDIRRLQTVWTTVTPNKHTLADTERLLASYSLSFWDALLIAACLDAGVTRLYTEDFSAYPLIEGLEIRNPFAVP